MLVTKKKKKGRFNPYKFDRTQALSSVGTIHIHKPIEEPDRGGSPHSFITVKYL
jgi:hypothetical protein